MRSATTASGTTPRPSPSPVRLFLAGRPARSTLAAAVIIGVLTAWLGTWGTPTLPLYAAAGVALLSLGPIRATSAAAQTDAFEAQRIYKGALHRLIWESSLVLAGGLALGPLLGW